MNNKNIIKISIGCCILNLECEDRKHDEGCKLNFIWNVILLREN